MRAGAVVGGRCVARVDANLLPHLDQLPKEVGGIVVAHKEAQRARESGGLAGKDGAACAQHEAHVQQRDAARVCAANGPLARE